MQFWQSTGFHENHRLALDEALNTLPHEVKNADFVCVFISLDFAANLSEIQSTLLNTLNPKHLIGCTTHHICDVQGTLTSQPGLSLLIGRCPDVRFYPFHVEGGVQASMEDLLRAVLKKQPAQLNALFLGDPFSAPIEPFLADWPDVDISMVGGLPSGGRAPGAHGFILQDKLYRSGFVGLFMEGNIRLDPVVSQSLRPLGSPYFVTKYEDNEIITLDGKNPLKIIENLYNQADEEDRDLIENDLVVSVMKNTGVDVFSEGLYQSYDIVEVNEERGTLVLEGKLDQPQLVQLQLRDMEVAALDLEQQLQRYDENNYGQNPAHAILMFSSINRMKHWSPEKRVMDFYLNDKRPFGLSTRSELFSTGQRGECMTHALIAALIREA